MKLFSETPQPALYRARWGSPISASSRGHRSGSQAEDRQVKLKHLGATRQDSGPVTPQTEEKIALALVEFLPSLGLMVVGMVAPPSGSGSSLLGPVASL